MGKNKNSNIVFDGIEFDSQEELEFYYWIQEAIQHCFISEFVYQPETVTLSAAIKIGYQKQLKTKVKDVSQHLCDGHVYTPDFKIKPTNKFLELTHKLKPIHLSTHYDGWYWIDVKGSFNKHGGDRSFSINQKWVWQEHGIFINKVVPEKFFKTVWVPQSVRFTPKTNKLRAKYAKCKTIGEF